MPQRAARPYHVERENVRKQFDSERVSDPIRKLEKSRAWRNVARLIRARDPLCKSCKLEPTHDVDHIIRARDYIAMKGGDLAYYFDESNLQGLCKRCHSRKTSDEVGFAAATL